MSDIVDDAAKAIEANAAVSIAAITNRSPEKNTSGFCLLCDEEISKNRLKHNPGCNHCLQCQADLEYRNNQSKRF